MKRVGVLGAGTMGSRIAAHFANIGVPSLLLDLDEATARKGIETAIQQRPGAFFLDGSAARITPGSFDKDLAKLGECDWVIEAVKEDLAVKRSLWEKVAAVASPEAILSTNTSGIPLKSIAEGFPSEFRKRFLGTHFFNPPRYLHLMEMIPGPETRADILDFVAKYADERLGKGVVPCKDTPNFIGNRIGCFFGATVTKITLEDGYTVEEVDALTGSLMGLPNSASFRLLDIVGLDVMVAVSDNLYHGVPEDPWRERFQIPALYREMLGRHWLGEKTGQGFYKRVGKEKEIHALDLKTLEYALAAKPKFPAAEDAKRIENLGERLRTLIAGMDRAGVFLWKLLSDYFLYAAERSPEIADRLVDVDRAMRWGYAHKLGPFEMWDAIGFQQVCDRLEREGRALPEMVQRMCRAGRRGFYDADQRAYLDFASDLYHPVQAPGLLLKHTSTIRQNAGASLKDLGDGVLCVEFHSKMNTIAFDQMEMIEAGLAEVEANAEAMVIGNQGEVFSAGANLLQVLLAAQDEEWDELDRMIRRFQQMNLKIKYSPKPVVVAVFGRALGGGCEIPLHGSKVQASAETYMGLVEVGVGVIPAAGGCKEMVARLGDARKAFELIGMAKVSSCAAEAKALGYLRESDGVSINPDRLIGDAKRAALGLARNFTPPVPVPIPVGGESAFAMLKLGAWTYRQGGYISEYDQFIGEKLAHVLSGGRLTGSQSVSEQYLLDLEREVFLSLCGNPKTQERIQHMLKTGKALRN